MKQIISRSEGDTREIAAQVLKNLPHGGLVCLYGDLGSGKTVFAKGFAAALGLKESEIKSPTYTLVREYDAKKGKKMFHFDFYRIEEPDELMVSDLKEIFGDKKNWIIVEWPERVETVLPEMNSRVDIKIGYRSEKERRLQIQYHDE